MKNLMLATFIGLQAFQALADTANYECTLNDGSSLKIVLHGSKDAKATLGQKAEWGTYLMSDEPLGTRLSGSKDLEVSFHSLNAFLIMSSPDFDKAFGTVSLKDASGQIQKEIGVDCTIEYLTF